MLQWMISWMSTRHVTFIQQPDFHLFVSRDISRLTFISHYRTDKIIMNVQYDIDSIDKMTVSFLHSRERNYSVNSWEKFFRLSAYIFIEITLWIFHVNANEKFAKISISLQSMNLLIRKMSLIIAWNCNQYARIASKIYPKKFKKHSIFQRLE